jgi:hypothetical protein
MGLARHVDRGSGRRLQHEGQPRAGARRQEQVRESSCRQRRDREGDVGLSVAIEIHPEAPRFARGRVARRGRLSPTRPSRNQIGRAPSIVVPDDL